MNMQIDFKRHSKSQFLSPEQIEEFGAKVDAIRREVMDDLGEKDAEYIYKIRNFVRYSEIASRGMLMFAGWLPPVWLAGTGLLGLSKIVENMELGHNVMHGQFDWMNDPSLNGATYDWDTISTGDDWKYTHNYIHDPFRQYWYKYGEYSCAYISSHPQSTWYPSHNWHHSDSGH